jgi:hypothetical protein
MESKVIVQPGAVVLGSDIVIGTKMGMTSEVVLGSVMVPPVEKALVYEVPVGFELVMGSVM